MMALLCVRPLWLLPQHPAVGSSPVRPVSMAEAALVDGTLSKNLCTYMHSLAGGTY